MCVPWFVHRLSLSASSGLDSGQTETDGATALDRQVLSNFHVMAEVDITTQSFHAVGEL